MLSKTRRVETEWLDDLRPDDADAVRSRRDLARVNTFMLQTAIMAQALSKHSVGKKKPRIVLDLGGGDGSFMLRVARRLAPRWQDVTIILLDRKDIVSAKTRRGFGQVRWNLETVTGDVFDFLESSALTKMDIVVANLFLHHFEPERLIRLLALVAQRTELFVACEPRRALVPLIASRLLGALGCNHVTRHDAVASVRAGFNDRELSELWPDGEGWKLYERTSMPFTHCFMARRMPGLAL